MVVEKGMPMTHDSDPVEEPPLNIPEPPSTPTNPDQLVGPDGPDGPDAEHSGSAGKPDGSSREYPQPTIPAASASTGPAASASTGPDGPAPSVDGSTAGEAAVAAAVEPDSDTEPDSDSEDDQDNRDNEVNLDDVDPVDDPSNPDLIDRDVADDDRTRAKPSTRMTKIPPAPKPGPQPRNLKESP